MQHSHRISCADILTLAKTQLRAAGVESSALDADLLLAEVLDVTREKIIGYPEMEMRQDECDRFLALVNRRVQREPMAHLLGRREFWGRVFKVTKDTLDPRPDSETLIEAVLEQFPDRMRVLKILDLGTGTGCLLLTLLAEFPNARGVGVDICEAALGVAKENARKLGVANRAEFVIDNWAEGVETTFDLVISNPPYIKNSDIEALEPEVARYEPRGALAGGADGLECYRQIAPQLNRLLAEKAVVVLEFGQGQEWQVREEFEASNLSFVSFEKDLAGVTRCLVAKKQ